MKGKGIFSVILNYCALAILVAIISFLIYTLFLFINKSENSHFNNSISFSLNEIHLKKIDSTIISTNSKFIKEFNLRMDSLKSDIVELKDIKAKIEEAEKRNDDYFRLVFALIGSVFAIVGFFGFKSIHDTRENAIKNATDEAKKIAEQEAIKSSADIITKTEFEANKILLETKLDIQSIKLEHKSLIETIEEMQKQISDTQMEINGYNVEPNAGNGNMSNEGNADKNVKEEDITDQ